MRGSNPHGQPALITGGAGFIGTNLADRLLQDGHSVIIIDSLARPGVERNVRWLRQKHGRRLQIEVADIRDPVAVRRAVRQSSRVFHFAGQVAVTTSLADPIADFEVNVAGTLRILEASRECEEPPPIVFTSTNKVYGNLSDLRLRLNGSRYEPEDQDVHDYGLGETRPLDFQSPYGCSKGAADQYVLDYARSYGLPAVVFRMSCIYGPHQFGTEDQGWVAHFLIRAIEDKPISIFGDGKQVRDALFVDDLVDALLLAQANARTLAGQAFNIGGGPENVTSLLDLVDLIAELRGEAPALTFGPWRSGDQRYYVADVRKFAAATGWRPTTSVRHGVTALYHWLLASRGTVARRGRGVQTSQIAVL